MTRARRRKAIKELAPGSVSPSAPAAPVPTPPPHPLSPSPYTYTFFGAASRRTRSTVICRNWKQTPGALPLARAERSCPSPTGQRHSRSPHGRSLAPWGLHSPEPGSPPRKRWIYLMQNEMSISSPSLSRLERTRNTPPRKPKKSFSQQGSRGVGFWGAGAKAKGRERGRAVSLVVCALLHRQPGARGRPGPYRLGGRPGPATGARGGDAASGRAAGSRRGRGEPPPLLPGAGAGEGRRRWRRSLGRGRRGAASPPPPPRLGNAPPAATPAGRPAGPGSARAASRPPVPGAPPRALPNPSGAGRRLHAGSRFRARPRRPRRTREPRRAARQHGGPRGPRSPCVTLAAPRPREVVAQLGLHLGRPGRPRPRPCHSTLPGLLEGRGSLAPALPSA